MEKLLLLTTAIVFIGFPAFFTDGQQHVKLDHLIVEKIVYKSEDAGKTWKDISEGLPEHFNEINSFTNENGLFLRSGNGLYQSKSTSGAPFWEREDFFDKHSSIASVKEGMVSYNDDGEFFLNEKGTNTWKPVYTNFKGRQVHNVFETESGNILIASNSGLFRSDNKGKKWNQVYDAGWVMKMVESKGVLLATSQEGIIRSTDEGNTWKPVISEGGVGIAIERINGGFAAISYNTESRTRRVRVSYDGGENWQAIDSGLPVEDFMARGFTALTINTEVNSNTKMPVNAFISSIVQVGDYFFCGHPSGIFRSGDKGKTWQLVFPSDGNKIFNLSVSGNVMYAISRSRGC